MEERRSDGSRRGRGRPLRGLDGMGPTCARYEVPYWEPPLLYATGVVGLVVCAIMLGIGDPGAAVLVLGTLLAGAWYWFVWSAHVGVMGADGELWFATPVRSWHLSAEDVRRISVSEVQGTPVTFVIRTRSDVVRLRFGEGREIIDSILAVNPTVLLKGYTRPEPAEVREAGQPTAPPAPPEAGRRASARVWTVIAAGTFVVWVGLATLMGADSDSEGVGWREGAVVGAASWVLLAGVFVATGWFSRGAPLPARWASRLQRGHGESPRRPH